MIFVAVGTQMFPFDRLVIAVDQLVEKGIIKEHVRVQSGQASYQPKHCDVVPFMESSDFMRNIAECDLFITHCGVGSILNALSMKKKILAVPRQKKFGEHVDDHQQEIGKEFESMGLIICCEKIDDLAASIVACRQLEPKEVRISYKNAGKCIEQYLKQQFGGDSFE